MNTRKFAALPLLLGGLTMVGSLSMDTFLPAMHAMQDVFQVSLLHMQQALSVYLICYSLMILWHGALSDALGRRAIIMTALLVYTVASIGCALSQNLPQLLFFRGIQGLCGGTGWIVGRAVIRDFYEGDTAQRVMSHVTMVFSLSPALAPVIGGWLFSHFGWQSVFVFMALISALLLAWTAWGLAESLPLEKRSHFSVRHLFRNYMQVGASWRFMLLTSSLAFNSAGFFLYVCSAPEFLMQHLKLPPTAFLWLFGPLVIGMIVGSYLAGKLLGRRSSRELVSLGYGVMGIAALINVGYCAGFTPVLPWSIVAIPLYTAGMALAAPALTIVLMDRIPTLRGTASFLARFFPYLVIKPGRRCDLSLAMGYPLTFGLGHGGCDQYKFCFFVVVSPFAHMQSTVHGRRDRGSYATLNNACSTIFFGRTRVLTYRMACLVASHLD